MRCLGVLLGVICLSCMLLSACAPQAEAPTQPVAEEAPKTESDVEAIKELKLEVDAAYRAGDMARLSELFTEDIVFLPPNEPAVVGKQAAIVWSEQFIETFAVKETRVTFHEVEVAGDWAYLRMDILWNLVPKPEGEPIQNFGKVLVICQRQTDGSWRFARDMWNNSPPPEGPAN